MPCPKKISKCKVQSVDFKLTHYLKSEARTAVAAFLKVQTVWSEAPISRHMDKEGLAAAGGGCRGGSKIVDSRDAVSVPRPNNPRRSLRPLLSLGGEFIFKRSGKLVSRNLLHLTVIGDLS